MIPAQPPVADVLEDVQAFLVLRADAIAKRVALDPAFADAAEAMRRQLAVIGDDLRAGMHEGAARALAKRAGPAAGDAA